MKMLLVLLRWLHELATVTWLGGLFTLGVVLFPSARRALGPGPHLRQLMESFQKRLSTLVYISMATLIITGLPLARHNPHFQGLFSLGNTYSITLTIKHVLVLLMVAIGLTRSLILVRKGQPGQDKEKLKAGLLYLNLGLGLIVLLLSSMSVYLS